MPRTTRVVALPAPEEDAIPTREGVDTDTEQAETSPEPEPQPAEQPVPNAQPRPRGRPRGPNAAFMTQWPVPPKKTFFDAGEFFRYVRSIPKDKRNRGMMHFRRYEPVEVYKKPRNWVKIPMDTEPFPFDHESWEQAVLATMGSGKYGCYLNESNLPPEKGDATIAECFEIKTRWDLEQYPPVMDVADVDESAVGNQSYIQWLRGRGTRLPSEHGQDDNDMAVNEKLVDALIGQQARANTPVPPPVYRESAADKLTLEGATAVIGMVKKQAEGMTAVQTQAADPIALLNTVVSVAREMNGGNDGTKSMIDSLCRRLEASEDRAAKLMDRLLDAKTAPPAQPEKPKTLLEQINEMSNTKEALANFLGLGDKGGGEPEPKSGSIKEQMIMKALENAGPIMAGLGGLADKFITGAVTATAVAKGQPVPQAVAAPQPPPPPPAPPLTIPSGWNEQKVRGYFQAFGLFQQKLLKDFKSAVAGDSEPPVSGYDFAEWLIAGWGEVPAYTGIVADCKNTAGELDIEPLMTVIKQYPPIWNEVSTVEQEFRQFLLEFLTVKDQPAEDVQEQVQ